MCSSKSKPYPSAEPNINARPVLHPKNSNRLESRTSLKKALPEAPSPRQAAVKRGKDANDVNSSGDKVLILRSLASSVKKSRNSGEAPLRRSLPLVPGSIAAARREEVATAREQRKLRTAHYGRAKSSKEALEIASPAAPEQKRCSYITAHSDPVYVAYHDDEWGVPVHDDYLLFELLVLTGAQVGSDWTSLLKKRQTFRAAFSGFDAEAVSRYNEKKIMSISADHNIEVKLIRGAVDNAVQILEVKKAFGSLENYLWGFMNHKPVSTQYRSCQRIPVKTSKSETISKDLVRRGFRSVGPTTIHSFMQAAGLTNDHLTTCPRHLQCLALASAQRAAVAPAL